MTEKLIAGFNVLMDELQSDLGSAELSADIWSSKNAQSLVGYNSNPTAVALFNEITRMTNKALKDSKFPGLDNYYMMHLEQENLLLVVISDDYVLGLLVDGNKTTMGVLLGVVLPKIKIMLKEATS